MDNASTDGSAEMVGSDFPHVKLCQNRANRGFAAAANQAIRASTTPYVLLLNGDTYVRPSTLNALATYLAEFSQVGLVGPRLVNPDGSVQTSCFKFPSLLSLFLYLSGAYRLIRHIPILHRHSLRAWAHDQARPIPWVLGAALAIRRDAFEDVGGFDESFYMYFEEVDLCYRLALRGWQVHFAPVAEVVHIGGASAQQLQGEMTIRYFESLVHFYVRHYPRRSRIGLAVLIQCFALAHWLPNRVLLLITREGNKRAMVAHDIEMWRRVLATSRPRPAMAGCGP